MLFHRVRFPIALFTCFIGFLFFAAPSVHAFAVSPVIVDLDIEPGKAQSGSIRITNNAETIQTFYVGIQKFVAQGEEGQQDFLPESDSTGLASWIFPDSRNITLGPNEEKDFRYVVNVPANAEPGGHYAAIFFSTQPDTGEGESAVGVGAKTGVLFLLRVPGDIKEDARVETFRVSNSSSLNRLPAYFDLRIRNLGNVHFRPEGDIVVRNVFGSMSGRVPVNPNRSAVLPNSIRRVDSYWAKTLEVPTGGFFTELKNEWDNFAFGRYTAQLAVKYGTSQKPLDGTVSFWVIPWRILVVAFLFLILLILILKGYNRLVVRAAMKKAAQKK